MSFADRPPKMWSEFLSAVQFLTRIPVPPQPYEDGSLSRAVKFFPLAGIVVGGSAALLHLLLAPHLPRLVTASLVLLYLVLVTGCLHEDGLADAADGFGGGTSREQILLILRDSRIGSYGGTALILSLLGRLVLISSLPTAQVAQYLIVAHMLSRWTSLPLSYYLPSARAQDAQKIDGQGARIARLTSTGTLIGGTIFSFAVSAFLLGTHAIFPILITISLTLLTGLYYRQRILGITGDCFGATNQLAEIAVYLCGAWIS
ncbi:adenosylcobinamide-GDP ribazoletransferase [Granulicella arctica]|uniref:Adenosylcobinamide-GDP ribazoletransferase n=1 Tax=Granulicella arctica TaxID=940613 RepID=A0A7Y9PJ59_9BACT|nr:adenosylcobinamide-GDP ribazoletransferase [Granulicella arctica]NYF80043.1 adenosylcobinamide-GDP ribazoletransferase [Granulicella arctica]